MPLFGKYRLAGKHYIANIAVDEKTLSGLAIVDRDPRKWRFPPDAYVGRIEETGPLCKLVKPGDVATIQRWTWLQLDLDDERICGGEDHILLVNGVPVNAVVVVKLIPQIKPKTAALILPGAEKQEKKYSYYNGEIISTSVSAVKLGDKVWLKKGDRDQWKLGADKLVFRWDNPESDPFSNLMATQEKFQFEVVT